MIEQCFSSLFVKLKHFLLSTSGLFLFDESLERTNFSVRDFFYEVACLQKQSKWVWHLKFFWAVKTSSLKIWEGLCSKLLKFAVHSMFWIHYIMGWEQLSINQENLLLKQINSSPSFKYGTDFMHMLECIWTRPLNSINYNLHSLHKHLVLYFHICHNSLGKVHIWDLWSGVHKLLIKYCI